jgi:outer membrane receptor protein involved in Fe transport
MNHRYTILALCLLFFSPVFSQFPGMGRPGSSPTIKGKISGTVMDSISGKPVEFATVVLINPKFGKQLDGGLTDEKGNFKITDVTNGSYQLNISFLGYAEKKITDLEITLEKPDLDLGIVYMIPEGINLSEVTVTEEAALIENKIDKIVFNAEKDVTTAGGNATEVLGKVPLLAVDFDGNVSLRGSRNIQILINGRPSTLLADNVANVLKTIPADQIKKVEVITTPGARYDGEGSAGIINIITKKKSVEGITGSVSGAVGTRQNNANLSFSAAKGRFGVNMNAGSFLSWPREGNVSFYREDLIAGQKRVFEQEGPSESYSYGPGGSLSAFYDINAYNSINSSISFRGFGSSNEGTINARFADPLAGIFQTYERFNDNSSLNGGFDWTSDYRKTFEQPERELSFGFQISGSNSNRNTVIEQSGSDPGLLIREKNDNDGLNLETILQVDYVHPFSDKLKLETGAKTTLRNIDSDYTYRSFNVDQDRFVIDPRRTDIFFYNQDVWAAYASFNVKFGKKTGLIAGARYESTAIAGDFDVETNTFANDYGNILPSIILSQTLKGFQTIKLSYSQRIQRPSLFYINPFVDLSDTRNISFGNPELLPELTDLYEINYNTFFKGIVLNGSVYYRHTRDVIENILTIRPDGVSATTYLNVGQNDVLGFNFFTSLKILKIWEIRGNFNANTYDATGIINGQEVSRRTAIWNAFVNSTFSFKKGFKAEIFGFYNAPRQTLQGTNASFSLMSVGFKKEILDKKASLGLTIIDPFSENKAFPSSLSGENFVQESTFEIPFRSFGINFSYNFGKLDFNQQRQRRSRIKNDDLKEGSDNRF